MPLTKTISIDDVRALVDEAAAWGIRRVALTGAGEPFRDPAMLEHVAYANAREAAAVVDTLLAFARDVAALERPTAERQPEPDTTCDPVEPAVPV